MVVMKATCRCMPSIINSNISRLAPQFLERMLRMALLHLVLPLPPLHRQVRLLPHLRQVLPRQEDIMRLVIKIVMLVNGLLSLIGTSAPWDVTRQPSK
jgi:hypothetical protein